ncbi:WXG100-like domain-containing protein [Nocardia sp. X0981]
MGATLPEPLQVLLGLVGGAEWPDGDEDRMWELARVLRAGADALESAAPDVRRAHHEALAAYPTGRAHEAMDGLFQEIERFLPQVVESLRGLATSARDTGGAIESAKFQIWSALALLALELIISKLFPATSALQDAAAMAATRTTLQAVARWLLVNIGALGWRQAIPSLAVRLAGHGILGGGIAALQDTAIQLWAIEHGNQSEGFRYEQLSAMIGGGFGGGVAAGGFGQVVQRLRYTDWGLDHLTMPRTLGLQIVGGGVLGGLGGWLGGGLVSGDFTFDYRMISAGVIGAGAAVGSHQGMHAFGMRHSGGRIESLSRRVGPIIKLGQMLGVDPGEAPVRARTPVTVGREPGAGGTPAAPAGPVIRGYAEPGTGPRDPAGAPGPRESPARTAWAGTQVSDPATAAAGTTGAVPTARATEAGGPAGRPETPGTATTAFTPGVRPDPGPAGSRDQVRPFAGEAGVSYRPPPPGPGEQPAAPGTPNRHGAEQAEVPSQPGTPTGLGETTPLQQPGNGTRAVETDEVAPALEASHRHSVPPQPAEAIGEPGSAAVPEPGHTPQDIPVTGSPDRPDSTSPQFAEAVPEDGVTDTGVPHEDDSPRLADRLQDLGVDPVAVEAMVHEAFRTLKSEGHIDMTWREYFSMVSERSFAGGPLFGRRSLRTGEAFAAALEHALRSGGLDMRHPDYSLLRALYSAVTGNPVDITAEMRRLRVAQRLGIENPYSWIHVQQWEAAIDRIRYQLVQERNGLDPADAPATRRLEARERLLAELIDLVGPVPVDSMEGYPPHQDPAGPSDGPLAGHPSPRPPSAGPAAARLVPLPLTAVSAGPQPDGSAPRDVDPGADPATGTVRPEPAGSSGEQPGPVRQGEVPVAAAESASAPDEGGPAGPSTRPHRNTADPAAAEWEGAGRTGADDIARVNRLIAEAGIRIEEYQGVPVETLEALVPVLQELAGRYAGVSEGVWFAWLSEHGDGPVAVVRDGWLVVDPRAGRALAYQDSHQRLVRFYADELAAYRRREESGPAGGRPRDEGRLDTDAVPSGDPVAEPDPVDPDAADVSADRTGEAGRVPVESRYRRATEALTDSYLRALAEPESTRAESGTSPDRGETLPGSRDTATGPMPEEGARTAGRGPRARDGGEAEVDSVTGAGDASAREPRAESADNSRAMASPVTGRDGVVPTEADELALKNRLVGDAGVRVEGFESREVPVEMLEALVPVLARLTSRYPGALEGVRFEWLSEDGAGAAGVARDGWLVLDPRVVGLPVSRSAADMPLVELVTRRFAEILLARDASALGRAHQFADSLRGQLRAEGERPAARREWRRFRRMAPQRAVVEAFWRVEQEGADPKHPSYAYYRALVAAPEAALDLPREQRLWRLAAEAGVQDAYRSDTNGLIRELEVLRDRLDAEVDELAVELPNLPARVAPVVAGLHNGRVESYAALFEMVHRRKPTEFEKPRSIRGFERLRWSRGDSRDDDPPWKAVAEALAGERAAELGVRTEAERLVLASLFIDKRHLDIAVVAGQPHPELLYGGREWAGFLDATAHARAYGDRELTVPFVLELHRRLTAMAAPEIAGALVESQAIGVQQDPLTAEQKEALDANPYIEYHDGPSYLGGSALLFYAGFPFENASMPGAERQSSFLQALCDWYNGVRRGPGDPYAIAAALQRIIVSVHPFADFNGRLSRILMNWALENAGLPPSAVHDPNSDVLTSPQEWTAAVRAGSERYENLRNRARLMGPDADPVELFGLEELHRRYRELDGRVAPFEDEVNHSEELKRLHRDLHEAAADSGAGTYERMPEARSPGNGRPPESRESPRAVGKEVSHPAAPHGGGHRPGDVAPVSPVEHGGGDGRRHRDGDPPATYRSEHGRLYPHDPPPGQLGPAPAPDSPVGGGQPFRPVGLDERFRAGELPEGPGTRQAGYPGAVDAPQHPDQPRRRDGSWDGAPPPSEVDTRPGPATGPPRPAPPVESRHGVDRIREEPDSAVHRPVETDEDLARPGAARSDPAHRQSPHSLEGIPAGTREAGPVVAHRSTPPVYPDRRRRNQELDRLLAAADRERGRLEALRDKALAEIAADRDGTMSDERRTSLEADLANHRYADEAHTWLSALSRARTAAEIHEVYYAAQARDEAARLFLPWDPERSVEQLRPYRSESERLATLLDMHSRARAEVHRLDRIFDQGLADRRVVPRPPDPAAVHDDGGAVWRAAADVTAEGAIDRSPFAESVVLLTDSQLQARAGGRVLATIGHAALAAELKRLGPGSSALVIDKNSWTGGARRYQLVNYEMLIIVIDRTYGSVSEFTPPVVGVEVKTNAVLFDRTGRCVHPIGVDELHMRPHSENLTFWQRGEIVQRLAAVYTERGMLVGEIERMLERLGFGWTGDLRNASDRRRLSAELNDPAGEWISTSEITALEGLVSKLGQLQRIADDLDAFRAIGRDLGRAELAYEQYSASYRQLAAETGLSEQPRDTAATGLSGDRIGELLALGTGVLETETKVRGYERELLQALQDRTPVRPVDWTQIDQYCMQSAIIDAMWHSDAGIEPLDWDVSLDGTAVYAAAAALGAVPEPFDTRADLESYLDTLPVGAWIAVMDEGPTAAHGYRAIRTQHGIVIREWAGMESYSYPPKARAEVTRISGIVYLDRDTPKLPLSETDRRLLWQLAREQNDLKVQWRRLTTVFLEHSAHFPAEIVGDLRTDWTSPVAVETRIERLRQWTNQLPDPSENGRYADRIDRLGAAAARILAVSERVAAVDTRAQRMLAPDSHRDPSGPSVHYRGTPSPRPRDGEEGSPAAPAVVTPISGGVPAPASPAAAAQIREGVPGDVGDARLATPEELDSPETTSDRAPHTAPAPVPLVRNTSRDGADVLRVLAARTGDGRFPVPDVDAPHISDSDLQRYTGGRLLRIPHHDYLRTVLNDPDHPAVAAVVVERGRSRVRYVVVHEHGANVVVRPDETRTPYTETAGNAVPFAILFDADWNPVDPVGADVHAWPQTANTFIESSVRPAMVLLQAAVELSRARAGVAELAELLAIPESRLAGPERTRTLSELEAESAAGAVGFRGALVEAMITAIRQQDRIEAEFAAMASISAERIMAIRSREVADSEFRSLAVESDGAPHRPSTARPAVSDSSPDGRGDLVVRREQADRARQYWESEVQRHERELLRTAGRRPATTDPALLEHFAHSCSGLATVVLLGLTGNPGIRLPVRAPYDYGWDWFEIVSDIGGRPIRLDNLDAAREHLCPGETMMVLTTFAEIPGGHVLVLHREGDRIHVFDHGGALVHDWPPEQRETWGKLEGIVFRADGTHADPVPDAIRSRLDELRYSIVHRTHEEIDRANSIARRLVYGAAASAVPGPGMPADPIPPESSPDTPAAFRGPDHRLHLAGESPAMPGPPRTLLPAGGAGPEATVERSPGPLAVSRDDNRPAADRDEPSGGLDGIRAEGAVVRGPEATTGEQSYRYADRQSRNQYLDRMLGAADRERGRLAAVYHEALRERSELLRAGNDGRADAGARIAMLDADIAAYEYAQEAHIWLNSVSRARTAAELDEVYAIHLARREAERSGLPWESGRPVIDRLREHRAANARIAAALDRYDRARAEVDRLDGVLDEGLADPHVVPGHLEPAVLPHDDGEAVLRAAADVTAPGRIDRSPFPESAFGLTDSRLQTKVRGRFMEMESHEALITELENLRSGASAVVIDRDRRTGLVHRYQLVNYHGLIIRIDRRYGLVQEFAPVVRAGMTSYAAVFGPDGHQLDPIAPGQGHLLPHSELRVNSVRDEVARRITAITIERGAVLGQAARIVEQLGTGWVGDLHTASDRKLLLDRLDAMTGEPMDRDRSSAVAELVTKLGQLEQIERALASFREMGQALVDTELRYEQYGVEYRRLASRIGFPDTSSGELRGSARDGALAGDIGELLALGTKLIDTEARARRYEQQLLDALRAREPFHEVDQAAIQNGCAQWTAIEAGWHAGDGVVELLTWDPSLAGTDVTVVAAMFGGVPERFAGTAQVGARLDSLPHGAWAVVMVLGTDIGHAYRMVKNGDDILVRDLAGYETYAYPPKKRGEIDAVHAIVFVDRKTPASPLPAADRALLWDLGRQLEDLRSERRELIRTIGVLADRFPPEAMEPRPEDWSSALAIDSGIVRLRQWADEQGDTAGREAVAARIDELERCAHRLNAVTIRSQSIDRRAWSLLEQGSGRESGTAAVRTDRLTPHGAGIPPVAVGRDRDPAPTGGAPDDGVPAARKQGPPVPDGALPVEAGQPHDQQPGDTAERRSLAARSAEVRAGLPENQRQRLRELFDFGYPPGRPTLDYLAEVLRDERLMIPEVFLDIELLDSVLAKSPLPEQVTVSYAQQVNPFGRLEGLQGSTQLVPGYIRAMPATLSRADTAGYHLEVTVPAGTPALLLGELSPLGPQVPEIVLGRGLLLRVDSVQDHGNGRAFIRATVAPPDIADPPPHTSAPRGIGGPSRDTHAPLHPVHGPDDDIVTDFTPRMIDQARPAVEDLLRRDVTVREFEWLATGLVWVERYEAGPVIAVVAVEAAHMAALRAAVVNHPGHFARLGHERVLYWEDLGFAHDTVWHLQIEPDGSVAFADPIDIDTLHRMVTVTDMAAAEVGGFLASLDAGKVRGGFDSWLLLLRDPETMGPLADSVLHVGPEGYMLLPNAHWRVLEYTNRHPLPEHHPAYTLRRLALLDLPLRGYPPEPGIEQPVRLGDRRITTVTVPVKLPFTVVVERDPVTEKWSLHDGPFGPAQDALVRRLGDRSAGSPQNLAKSIAKDLNGGLFTDVAARMRGSLRETGPVAPSAAPETAGRFRRPPSGIPGEAALVRLALDAVSDDMGRAGGSALPFEVVSFRRFAPAAAVLEGAQGQQVILVGAVEGRHAATMRELIRHHSDEFRRLQDGNGEIRHLLVRPDGTPVLLDSAGSAGSARLAFPFEVHEAMVAEYLRTKHVVDGGIDEWVWRGLPADFFVSDAGRAEGLARGQLAPDALWRAVAIDGGIPPDHTPAQVLWRLAEFDIPVPPRTPLDTSSVVGSVAFWVETGALRFPVVLEYVYRLGWRLDPTVHALAQDPLVAHFGELTAADPEKLAGLLARKLVGGRVVAAPAVHPGSWPEPAVHPAQVAELEQSVQSLTDRVHPAMPDPVLRARAEVDAELAAEVAASSGAQLIERLFAARRRDALAEVRYRDAVNELPDEIILLDLSHDDAGGYRMVEELRQQSEEIEAALRAAERAEHGRALAAQVDVGRWYRQTFPRDSFTEVRRFDDHAVTVTDGHTVRLVIVAVDGYHAIAEQQWRMANPALLEEIGRGEWIVDWLTVRPDESGEGVARVERVWRPARPGFAAVAAAVQVSRMTTEAEVVKRRIDILTGALEERYRATREQVSIRQEFESLAASRERPAGSGPVPDAVRGIPDSAHSRRTVAAVVDDLRAVLGAAADLAAGQVLRIADERGSLVVVAEPGGHLRALTRAGRHHPEIARVLSGESVPIAWVEVGLDGSAAPRVAVTEGLGAVVRRSGETTESFFPPAEGSLRDRLTASADLDPAHARVALEAVRGQIAGELAAHLHDVFPAAPHYALGDRGEVVDLLAAQPERTLAALRLRGVPEQVRAAVEAGFADLRLLGEHIAVADTDLADWLRGATDSAGPVRAIWPAVFRQPPAGLALCGHLAVVARNAWYHEVAGSRPMRLPDEPVAPGELIEPAGFSWLVGGHAEYLPGGPAEAAARLSGAEPGQSYTDTDPAVRARHSGRGMLLVESGAGEGAARLLVNEGGTVLVIDLAGGYIGPVTVESRGESIWHGIELDRSGNPTKPIASDYSVPPAVVDKSVRLRDGIGGAADEAPGSGSADPGRAPRAGEHDDAAPAEPGPPVPVVRVAEPDWGSGTGPRSVDSELVLRRLGERVAGDSLIVGQGAVVAALGEGARPPTRLEVAVPEAAYRYLREQPGWSERPGGEDARLVADRLSVGPGWHGAPPLPELWARSWTSPGGLRIASLPDVYALLQERGRPQDLLDAAAIRAHLHDPGRPPLPPYVLVRQMDAVRAILPAEALAHPDADTAIRLAANGMHITYTLYGDPEIGRVNQIIGDLEHPRYRVPATYHNGFGLLEDGLLLQTHLGAIGVRPHERLDAGAADNYSDAVYGNGRRRDNPGGYDELRSALLARAHALLLGYPRDRADRLFTMIMGSGFDQSTKAQVGKYDPDPLVQGIAGVDLQTLVLPGGLADAFAVAVEDLASARFSADRILGRVLVDFDLWIRSTAEGMLIIDEYAEYRPMIDGRRSELTVMDAFARRITGNAGFTANHEFPRTWTLANPELRAANANGSRALGAALADRRITAYRAFRAAQEYALRMERKYRHR